MLDSRLKRHILILDGAMGTMIMKSSPTEEDFRGERFSSHPIALKGCNDLLNLTRPDLIEAIHRDYLEAGADIISTNTFNSNPLSLSEYGLSEYAPEIAEAGARLARNTVDEYISSHIIPEEKRPFVAGSMGPTGVSLSITLQEGENPVESFNQMAEGYSRQAQALIKGGVDLLLLETVFDTLNAKAAIYGIKQAFSVIGKELPLMISATLTENGHLLSGQSLKEFIEAVDHARPISLGLNCGFGARALLPHLRLLSEMTDRYVSVHPNAGLPDELGNYIDSPERMEREVGEILKEGLVNIIGGCCGTTPDHIRRIATLAKDYPARLLPRLAESDNSFVKVGERCNVAGSRKFLRLVSENNWPECLDIAAGQLENGAAILDINMDDGLLDAKKSMKDFIIRLNADRRTSSTPLMIDSSDFSVISEALRLMPLKGVVNSISLKNGEKEFLSRARKIDALGSAMVVMAFDEKGQADTFERRVEICSRAYAVLTEKAGIRPSNIIFDPNVLAVATGIPDHDSYALDFIRTTEWIKQHLPGAKVSGGISNLSFSFRGIDPVRKAMHSLFLEYNIGKGMDMAIINPATPLSAEWIDNDLRILVDNVIMNRSKDASEALVEYALKIKAKIDAEKAAKKVSKTPISKPESSTEKTANQILSEKLISGDNSSLEEIIRLALEECNGSALNVVEKGLMKGMDKVGEMFGRGEMFLPQVVRSASFMKKAVDVLTPYMKSDSEKAGSGTLRPTIVLATVKGDVHDIGKNIVGVVLKCSGFDVIDLGVMVEPSRILETAKEKNASAIGLSGLITPSLHEMAVVAKMMERDGMKIPLFIGGATTSDLHTAMKIAPLYSGAVVHTSDAASLPNAVKRFIASDNSSSIYEHKKQQEELRNVHTKKETERVKQPLMSLEEVKKRNSKVSSPAPSPKKLGVFDLRIPVKDIMESINWREFLYEWKLNPASKKLFSSANSDAVSASTENLETDRLLTDADTLLNQLIDRGIMIDARVLISPCHTEGDDIILDSGLTLPMLRSQRPNPVKGTSVSISDFIASDGDYIGLFAVTLASSGIAQQIENQKRSDPYGSLLLQSLSHRLVEAATERMHNIVRKDIWGVEENIGIRPAVGYASLPDQSLVFLLDKVLDYSALGIELTEHGALSPSATTTGLIISNPEARYFEVGQISQEAFKEYAKRRNLSTAYLTPFFPKL